MPQGELLKFILRDATPKNVKIIAARGNAPLPPGEMLEVLVHLSRDSDSEIASLASQTLASWPVKDILDQVSNRDCSATLLEYFASASPSTQVVESIILNPATPASAIENLASIVSAAALETLLLNKVRLIERPQIVAHIKRNKAATPEILRQLQELESEFFSGKQSAYAVDSEQPKLEALTDLWDLESLPEFEDLYLEGLPTDPQAREGALSERLALMTIRQKIRLAMLGNREIRSILVRDTNREVSRSVLASPKLNENEVEAFAAMRNVSDDILREIGNSRKWTRSYNVVINLAKNPKTPPMISQRLLFRLLSKDLVGLTRDRSIPEPLRKSAQRMMSQRAMSKPH
jgi:hypothetical protein